MKHWQVMRLALLLTTWVLLTPATGQGFLQFGNNVINRDGFNALILDRNGVPVPKEHGRVCVLVHGIPLHLGSPADGTGVAFSDDGVFDLGVLSVPGYPAGDYRYNPRSLDSALSIFVWDRRHGATLGEVPPDYRAAFFAKLRRLGSRPEDAPDLVEGTDFSGIQLGIGPWPSGQVDLNNYNVFQGEMTYIRDPEGRPLSKAVGRVEFFLSRWHQPDLRFASPDDGTGNPLRDDGLFWMGYTHVPTTQAGHAYTLLLRAWDSSTGTTYETATTKWGAYIASSSFSPLGGNGLTIPRISFAGMQLVSPSVPLTISPVAGSAVRIRAEVVPGYTYRLLTSKTIAADPPYYQFRPPMTWEEVGDPMTSRGKTLTWTVPASDALGFFQVINRK